MWGGVEQDKGIGIWTDSEGKVTAISSCLSVGNLVLESSHTGR